MVHRYLDTFQDKLSKSEWNNLSSLLVRLNLNRCPTEILIDMNGMNMITDTMMH